MSEQNAKRFDSGRLCFTGYVVFVPLAIYFTLRCFASVKTSLVSLVCTYGYALSVYVPVSLLCIIPLEWMRWIFFLVGRVVYTLFTRVNSLDVRLDLRQTRAFF